jgi:ferrous iron transport protein B
MTKAKPLIGLAGNPNVGKTTVFNALTGMKQHTGNWPGKTVEQKTGTYAFRDRNYSIVDLPGTYSLNAISAEEVIARDFILDSELDCLIVVVDATCLERNLFLVSQILELTPRVVVALNLMDQAELLGIEIDLPRLSEALGVPVVSLVAVKKEGLDLLKEKVETIVFDKLVPEPKLINYSSEVEAMIRQVIPLIHNITYPKRWLAAKLLEEDTGIAQMMRDSGDLEAVQKADQLLHSVDSPLEIQIINTRYERLNQLCQTVLTKKNEGPSPTERIDAIATHRIYGPVVLLSVLGFTLWTIFKVAAPLGGIMETGFEALRSYTRFQLSATPFWLQGMVVDGLLLGIQQIFVYMLAVMLVFYLSYSILEDSGYLARGAYVANSILSSLGLPGKAFLSLFASLGCSVPGVMSTRILRAEDDRVLTSFVSPMIPCAARIAVIVSVVPLFFNGFQAILVSLSLLLVSFVAILLVALVLKRRLLPGATPGMIMEMPAYRLPVAMNVVKNTVYKTVASMRKALTVFMPFSILIWFSFNYPQEGVVYAARIASMLDVLGSIIGVSGKDFLPFLFSFPAKELTILYLNFAHGYGLTDEVGFLATHWTPLQAYSWLVFMTLYSPCLATVSALADELKSWRWPVMVMGQELLTGFLFAGLVYWGGSLLF